MNENASKRIIIAICVAVIWVALAVAGYNMYVTQQIAKLIESGTPPLEARCALSFNSVTCPNR